MYSILYEKDKSRHLTLWSSRSRLHYQRYLSIRHVFWTESLYGCESVVGAGCRYCPAYGGDMVLGDYGIKLQLPRLDIFGEVVEDS